MVGKLELIKDKHFYIILQYENSNKEPKYKHSYSSAGRTEKQAFEAALKDAKEISQEQNIPLEIKVKNPTNN